MNLTVTLVGFSIYLLVWEKFPDWGNWFNAGLNRLPAPIQSLYEQWRCAYCVGFWLALCLHATTGFWTLPALANLPLFWGIVGPIIGWILDALVTAMLIYIIKNIVDAIKLPAMKSFLLKEEFLETYSKRQKK